MGFLRFFMLVTLIQFMACLPIKMVLRWTINLKYRVHPGMVLKHMTGLRCGARFLRAPVVIGARKKRAPQGGRGDHGCIRPELSNSAYARYRLPHSRRWRCLLSVVWMMADDYYRPYKVEQRDFRTVEATLAQRMAVEQIPDGRNSKRRRRPSTTPARLTNPRKSRRRCAI